MVKVTFSDKTLLAGLVVGLATGAGITYVMTSQKKTRIYVNTEFYTYATKFFGVKNTDPTYNPLLDVDKNGIIEQKDIDFFGRNLDTWVEL